SQLDEHRCESLDLEKEVASEPRKERFIFFRSFQQFRFGSGKELDFHCLRCERTLSNTSSAGMDFTSPASKSALRRCTSSNHACSASGSAGPSSSSSSARRSCSFSGRAKLRISLSISD